MRCKVKELSWDGILYQRFADIPLLIQHDAGLVKETMAASVVKCFVEYCMPGRIDGFYGAPSQVDSQRALLLLSGS